ncbi:nucleotidyltransferase domain-containing protein [Mucilaginibacter phyllosphaerae]|uniref:Nucleotidyltransferase n=1 Tax=Mucilaginibacter phyllosphaerae TaxID=1812349 RepID=A0A4Y8AIE1_9SPHI|nr:nucleotidyltransferase domain-containing protein [Mucilaginibacter phyllosphaerae]MBB3968441.1 putative nucleotidyltransferase [Mucilaginibacter phyllosphaerae]TEW67911.1 nucleotidyltransferase domain-containing protein [Mucilaginibacter phyllosphaerae]GGH15991.1 hypothetical protein GCM10007352_25090 [Mucilaginibacter phyllosphaerae]
MKYGLSSKNLTSITKVLRQFPAIKAAYLYGSRAKGNYKSSSDIDIMLKGNELDLYHLTQIMNELDDLLLPYQFDVAIYHHVTNKDILSHLDRVGVDLFTSVPYSSP